MENRPKAPVPINDLDSYPNASLTPRSNTTHEKSKVKPKQEGIVSSKNVTIRKQSAWKEAKHKIFEKEGEEVKKYLINDVLIPTVKETVSTAIANAVDMFLFGEARHTTRSTGGAILRGGHNRSGIYNNYSSISVNRSSGTSVRSSLANSPAIRDDISFYDFIFQTRAAAKDVLDRLNTIVCDYGVVTVADLYACIKDENGRSLICPYTYTSYGWTDLSNAGITLVRDGYLLNLPTPYIVD